MAVEFLHRFLCVDLKLTQFFFFGVLLESYFPCNWSSISLTALKVFFPCLELQI